MGLECRFMDAGGIGYHRGSMAAEGAGYPAAVGYMHDGAHEHGQWFGKLAERLDLEGDVAELQADRLFAKRVHPGDGVTQLGTKPRSYKSLEELVEDEMAHVLGQKTEDEITAEIAQLVADGTISAKLPKAQYKQLRDELRGTVEFIYSAEQLADMRDRVRSSLRHRFQVKRDVAMVDATTTVEKSISTVIDLYRAAARKGEPGCEKMLQLADEMEAGLERANARWIEEALQPRIFSREGRQNDPISAQVDTEGVAGASFYHREARPTPGMPGMPHHHRHNLISTTVLVRTEDGRLVFKKMDTAALRDARPELGALHDLFVQQELSAIGYRFQKVSYTNAYGQRAEMIALKGFGKQVRALVDEMSQRHDQIAETIKARSSAFLESEGRPPTVAELEKFRAEAWKGSRAAKAEFGGDRDAVLIDLAKKALGSEWLFKLHQLNQHGPAVPTLTSASISLMQRRQLAAAALAQLEEAGRTTFTMNQLRAAITAQAGSARWGERMDKETLTVEIGRVADAARALMLGVDGHAQTDAHVGIARRRDGESVWIRDGERRFVSKATWRREQDLVKWSGETRRGLQLNLRHLHAAHRRFQAKTNERGEVIGHELADDQLAAITALSTGATVATLLGEAGTGKTTSMEVLVDAWLSQSSVRVGVRFHKPRVIGLAVAQTAANKLAEDTHTTDRDYTKAAQIAQELDDARATLRDLKAAQRVPTFSPLAKSITDKDRADAARTHKRLADKIARQSATVKGLERDQKKVNARITGASYNVTAFRIAVTKGRETITPGSLIILDEAGMVSTADLHWVIDRARSAGARVLLLGDDKQLSPVAGSGGGFRMLHEEGKAHGHAAELSSVWRFRRTGADGASEQDHEYSALMARVRLGDETAISELSNWGERQADRFVAEALAGAILAARGPVLGEEDALEKKALTAALRAIAKERREELGGYMREVAGDVTADRAMLAHAQHLVGTSPWDEETVSEHLSSTRDKARAQFEESTEHGSPTHGPRNPVQGGTLEQMEERARVAWLADLRAGHHAVIAVDDNASRARLAQQGVTAMAEAGLLGTDLQLKLRDGSALYIGARVVSRKNDYSLRFAPRKGETRGQQIANRDEFTVLGHNPLTGALTVRHTDTGRSLELPYEYWSEEVESSLAYTTYSLQGQTVDRLHGVVSSASLGREGFYVMLTRARHATTAYLVTDELSTDAHDGAHKVQGIEQMLAQILRTEKSPMSARMQLEAGVRTFDSLATITTQREHWNDKVREDLHQAAAASFLEKVLAHPTFAQDAGATVATLETEDAYPALRTQLLRLAERGKLAEAERLLVGRGFDGAVDRAAIFSGRLKSLELSSEDASVEDAAVGVKLADPVSVLLPWMQKIPAGAPDGPFLEALRIREQDALALAALAGRDAIEHDAAWLSELGERPAAGPRAFQWRAVVSQVAAHREQWAVKGSDAELLGTWSPADAGPDVSQAAVRARQRSEAYVTQTLEEYLVGGRPLEQTDPGVDALIRRDKRQQEVEVDREIAPVAQVPVPADERRYGHLMDAQLDAQVRSYEAQVKTGEKSQKTLTAEIAALRAALPEQDADAKAGRGQSARAVEARLEHLKKVVEAQAEGRKIRKQLAVATGVDFARGIVPGLRKARAGHSQEHVDELNARWDEVEQVAGGTATWETNRKRLEDLEAAWDETFAQAVAMDQAVAAANHTALATKARALTAAAEKTAQRAAALLEMRDEKELRAKMTPQERAAWVREQNAKVRETTVPLTPQERAARDVPVVPVGQQVAAERGMSMGF